MKRRDLIKRIAREASRQGISWIEGEVGNRSTYYLPGRKIPIPATQSLTG